MKQFSLEEYLKNPSKKIVTRDGRDVRIICANFNNPDFPVVAEIKGHKWPISFATNGLLIKDGVEQPSDLFFAPEKHTDYINLYRNEFGYFLGGGEYSTEEEAKRVAARAVDTYITTIKAEWEK